MAVRTGIGWDSHRLVEGRAFVVGGVRIESPVGLDGHSDADVLTHAVIDALLGAAGLGDIGLLFPDTSADFKDADSMGLLAEVVRRVCDEEGWAIEHVDTTLVLERPKVGPHREAITASLSAGLRGASVNVKATTGEKVGFIGRGEGAGALAVATLTRP